MNRDNVDDRVLDQAPVSADHLLCEHKAGLCALYTPSSPLAVATDGGCWPNPGPGGWAWVSADGRHEAGSFGAGTNNIAELTAIKAALIAFSQTPLHIQYDSQYAGNCIQTWGPAWRRKGVTDKANIELIFSIIDLVEARTAPLTWEWVRGHDGHPLNEQADTLASKMVKMPHGHYESNHLQDQLGHVGIVDRELSAHMAGVLAFHQAFGRQVQAMPSTESVSNETAALNLRLIAEELDELRQAVAENDIVEMAHALGDLLYVVTSAALVYGIDLDAVFEEIQRSNMSKLGTDGRPVLREDGKILKGPDFFEPDLAAVLGCQRPLI